jgi:hypothetical protein
VPTSPGLGRGAGPEYVVSGGLGTLMFGIRMRVLFVCLFLCGNEPLVDFALGLFCNISLVGVFLFACVVVSLR